MSRHELPLISLAQFYLSHRGEKVSKNSTDCINPDGSWHCSGFPQGTLRWTREGPSPPVHSPHLKESCLPL